MAFSHGVVSYFAAFTFMLLFFNDGEYQVKGGHLFLANVGENIILNCSVGGHAGYILWDRKREAIKYLAWVNSVNDTGNLFFKINNDHFSQFHEASSPEQRSFALGVYDVNVNDSATYICRFGKKTNKYDVRVMECTDCLFYPSSESDPDKKFVNCSLHNFHGSHFELEVNITVNNNKNKTAFIEKDTLSFTISNGSLYSGSTIEFNPYPEKRNLGSNITCIIPPQPSTHPTSSLTTSSTMLITTQHEHPWTSTKSSSPPTHPTPSPTTTSSITTTTQYDQPSTSEIRSSSPLASETPFTSNAKIFKIIASIVSLVLVVLIVIFVIVRCKQTKRRHQRKSHQIDTNGPSADKAAPGERDYESIEKMSKTQPCELVDNILYESSDGMIERSASTSGDQMDTVLYTVPDKTGIINRVAMSKVIGNPSHLKNPNGNNAKICDHEPTESKQGQENQYEDVAMTGKGRDDDIPLYAMPNKGPRSAKNNPKSRPESESQEDVGAEIPLYAMPDKRRR